MPLAPERLRYALPKPFFMPFAVAAINRLPSSKLLFRKVSPRRPTAQDPEDPGKHRAVIVPGSPRGRLLWRQERPHTLPVSLGKLGDQRCDVGADRCYRRALATVLLPGASIAPARSNWTCRKTRSENSGANGASTCIIVVGRVRT